MFYIHHTTCISPQQTFGVVDIDTLKPAAGKKLLALEPVYDGIPPGVLRRMGKAVRMGVGAALPLLKEQPLLNGVVLGTANGGMEDCIKFLNQIIQYEEGILTPGNFVQSTPNAVAAQIGLISANKGYNITHVHSGLSFENAVLDVLMLLQEHPDHQYLLGAVDEISSYNYNIEYLGGWYKAEDVYGTDLFETQTPGSIAGEGAVMFLVNNAAAGAVAQVQAIRTIHTTDASVAASQLQQFIAAHLPAGETIDVLLTGENGDVRQHDFYNAAEALMPAETAVARFKHMSGEFPTASAMGIWLACHLFTTQQLPAHVVKKPVNGEIKNVLLYNTYKGLQHGFVLLRGMVEQ